MKQRSPEPAAGGWPFTVVFVLVAFGAGALVVIGAVLRTLLTGSL